MKKIKTIHRMASGHKIMLVLLCTIVQVYGQTGTEPLTSPLWATYFGSTSDDRTMDVKAASNGDVFITGSTNGTTFPASTVFPSKILGTAGNTNTYVARLKSDGTTVLWWTIISGTAFDMACRLAVDTDDNVYISGSTYASFGITSPAPIAPYQVGEDAFCAKINGENGDLIWHTYIGGSSNESAEGVDVDVSHNQVIIGGTTTSSNLPLQHADFGHTGGKDIFCANINATTGELRWTSQIGGYHIEHGWGAAIAPNGDAYVTGMKMGWVPADVPTNGYGSLDGGGDMICTKFEKDTGKILWYTAIGNAGTEIGWEVDVNSRGEVLISGHSSEDDIGGGPWNTTATSQAMLVSLKGTDGTLLYNRLYGGTKGENAYHLAVDSEDHIYIAGHTESEDLLSQEIAIRNRPYKDQYTGSHDIFVARFMDNNGNEPTLDWHTYYSTVESSSSVDVANGMTIAQDGSIYIGGDTRSSNFEVYNSTIQSTFSAGGRDGFVIKLKTIPNPILYGIKGTVRRKNKEATIPGSPISGITMRLSSSMNTETITSDTGEYEFSSLQEKTYVLTAEKSNTGIAPTVDFDDYLRLVNHFAKIKELSNPYDIIAADIDNSNEVNTDDRDLLFSILLGTPAPSITCKFIPKDFGSFNFIKDNSTFVIKIDPFPESLTYDPLKEDKIAQDFIGVELGEVCDECFKP